MADLILIFLVLQEYLDGSCVLRATCGTASIDLSESGGHQWRSRHLLLQQFLPTPVSLVQVYIWQLAVQRQYYFFSV